MEVCKFKTNLE